MSSNEYILDAVTFIKVAASLLDVCVKSKFVIVTYSYKSFADVDAWYLTLYYFCVVSYYIFYKGV